MGHDISVNRKGANETASAKDKKFVHLPNTCSWWKDFKIFLTSLQAKEIQSIGDYIKAFKDNDPFKEAKELTNLKVACQQVSKSPVNEKLFMEELLPWLAGKALAVDHLFTEGENHGLLKKLSKFQTGRITLTRQQVCTLMALSFFNAFDVQGSTFNHFSLLSILTIKTHSQQSKMLCLLQYFSQLMQAERNGEDLHKIKLSFERLVLKKAPDWSTSSKKLGVLLSREELIEENHTALQVDFANKFIGGGVLQLGNVQEEIRFVISPECLVSMLLFEEMESNEAILITGAERFSTYSGYGNKFDYTGPFIDPNPIDSEGRRCINIVAMDAVVAGYDGDEFSQQLIDRDINKAFVAFSAETSMDKANGKTPVASGNWGCGAFGGNKELKTLIQWMAASMAGRPLHYHMFDSTQLAKEQTEIFKLLSEKSVTIGELYQCVIKMDGNRDPFTVVRETFNN